MLKAEITKIEKLDDSVNYTVKFTDDSAVNDAGIERNYNFVMVNDIATSLDATIKSELQRLTDLKEMFTTIESKIGTIYTLDK